MIPLLEGILFDLNNDVLETPPFRFLIICWNTVKLISVVLKCSLSIYQDSYISAECLYYISFN